jgi:hypothetical protein
MIEGGLHIKTSTLLQKLNVLKGKRDLPVTISTPTIDAMAVVEMVKVAIDTAPTYTATKQAKKRAKNPPAAARDIRTETMMALAVATSRKDMKIRRPVSAISVIVPTCHISTDEIMMTNSMCSL